MNSDSPILVFDTGVGGLTVLSEIQQLLPNAALIYAADYAGLPYGTKTEAEVAARVCGLLGRMAERYRPRLICIACNTASTIALGMVRDVLEIPIVGTVPAIKPAAALTKTGQIGLLGTEATIRQRYVDNLEAAFAADKNLIRYAAPALVDLAEAKLRGATLDPGAVATAISGLIDHEKGSEIDTIVLACTHFPILEAELALHLPDGVKFVHGAQGIAKRVADLTKDQEFARTQDDFAVVTTLFAQAEQASLANALQRYGIREIRQL